MEAASTLATAESLVCSKHTKRILCDFLSHLVFLATQPDIDGFLVGGASLKPEFVDIINVNKGKAS